MNIAHLSDIHFCAKNTQELRTIIPVLLDDLQQHHPERIIVSGDLFDTKLYAADPAFAQASWFLLALSAIAPTYVLQGTYSHDAPGMLVALSVLSSPESFIHFIHSPEIAPRSTILFIPPRRRTDEWTLESVLDAATNATVVVSHGTVFGCETEHDVPMLGVDHEFTPELFWRYPHIRAWLLGHIHKHQVWHGPDGQIAAYAGSLGRYHHGEMGEKYWLEWDIEEDGTVSVTPHRTKASTSVTVDFPSPPTAADLDRTIATVLEGADGRQVALRIRYSVDEEYRDAVDRASMEAALTAATLVGWKIEPRVNLVQTSRAPGVSRAKSLEEQVREYARLSDLNPEGILRALEMIRANTDDEVMEWLSRP